MTEEEVNKAMDALYDEFAEREADDLLVCDLCTKERVVDKTMLVIRVDDDYSTMPVGFHVCTTCFAFYDNDEQQIQQRLDSQN